MCGIVGYIGSRQAQQIILNGLKRLEYRGYDSAGLAVLERNGGIAIRRDVGKLTNLEKMVVESPLSGTIGIGHTRWATHGRPSQRNAHPHMGMNQKVVLVHNGIVENYAELRSELGMEGIDFSSDTDTEVIVQMVERYLEAGYDFRSAMHSTLIQLKGANAVVAMSPEFPEQLVCAKLGNAGGITIGLGDGEMFIASDLPAILEHTQRMTFLENGQMAVVDQNDYQVWDLDENEIESEVISIPWDPVSAVKGEHKHFMQKEIFEQPQALIDTLRGRVDFELHEINIPEMAITDEQARTLERMYIIACGSSFYAGQVGKYLIESIARLPVDVEYGSEFRYYDPILDEKTATLAITQSGETADTLAASEQAKEGGALLWSITNVIGSQSMRISHGVIPMQAGPEIGVATTKAFTVSLVNQYMLAIMLGERRGTITAPQKKKLIDNLALVPNLAGMVLERDEEYVELANHFFKARNFLFIGRGINYPIAMEGALKLKEISYIHAEGYPAGEMKHGPIALIDESMPVVAIATADNLYAKMVSQIEQAKARGGIVLAMATDGDEQIAKIADHVIYVPKAPVLLAPVINVIPLQLLSYHIAVRLGCDVDQPRNLAKSVTVE
ncbi:MAG: glutamine--fructose-6-phosphate transaminase (isomerizing) [Candidatus Promineifilaceae bacterium]|jgi:glucosamine--fructose-6-phosphate aminotransferase (isomerizing)